MGKYRKASEIKVGVVGYGGAFNMGRVHFEGARKAGMTPAAVAEPDPARRQVAEKEFPGVKTFATAREMLGGADVDLAIVITPHNTHAAIALECLRAGAHVVCEKPMAVTTAECDAMIREAAKRKLVLSAFHNRHWDGHIMTAVDQIVRKRVIGDVYKIDARMGDRNQPGDWWRTSKSISGGILYDWGVHLLEYGLQLIDARIVEVAGYAKTGYWGPRTKWGQDANEDEGSLRVRFDNGAWMSVTISALDPTVKPGILEITGTAGSYVMHWDTYEITRKEKGRTTIVRGRNRAGIWDAYHRNVARHLVKGEKLVITPEWARRPIHILDLANRSAREGRALKAKHA